MGTPDVLAHFKKALFSSAICFGTAILAKEPAIVFAPFYFGAITIYAFQQRKYWAPLAWLSIVMGTIFPYVAYAFLRGELFPYGSRWSGSIPGPSLIGAIQYQISRTGGIFWVQESDFMTQLNYWIKIDPILIIGGASTTLLLLITSLRKKANLIVALPSILYLIFLMRGGQVYGFYIIPLIPFFSMSIAIWSIHMYAYFIQRAQSRRFAQVVWLLLCILPFIIWYLIKTNPYTYNETKNQLDALAWISKNIPSNAKFIIDDYAYIEFHDNNKRNMYRLPSIGEYYWNTDSNSIIKTDIFGDRWQNIQYVLATPQMRQDTLYSNLPLTKAALDHGIIIQSFSDDGLPVDILKVNDDR